MSLVIPPRLNAGDSVAVIATARSVNQQSIKKGIDILQKWGLNVLPGKSLFKKHHLFAGTDQERLEDLQDALDNQQIKAIFCARGGYGTTRILDSVNWENFQKFPKWVCGFSDVTVLLCHINSLGIACVHSTMPQLFCADNAAKGVESLKAVLFDEEGPSIEAPFHKENHLGIGSGQLVGGNISLLVNQLGTGTELITENSILILEEVDEYLYHLDRMMVQLKRSGKLQQLAGVAIGYLTKMKEGDLKFGTSAEGVIRSHLKQNAFPIGFGFPIGHQSPNMAIPLGVRGQLEVTNRGSRIILNN